MRSRSDADVLAVDFGTSNSAAAVLEGGRVRHVPIERGAATLPTAVFFPADRGPMRIGQAAVDALIEGEEGRFMRALKSVLGTALLHERRTIAGRRCTLADVVTGFLAETKRRAEAETGRRFDAVLSGRPVRFSEDAGTDAAAEADLRACYEAAGFARVAFMAEPEAAAGAYAQARYGEDGQGGQDGQHGDGGGNRETGEEAGLIVDIGGGTSDFTVFRGRGEAAVLASRGVRLGGTDFDHALSMAEAMPRLGLGGTLRQQMGTGLLPVPRHVHVDLATWVRIPFLHTRETRDAVAGWARLATDPAGLARLEAALEMEAGHELAFAVERGKIDANRGQGDANRGHGAAIEMGMIEPGLRAPVTATALEAALAPHRTRLRRVAAETIEAAGLAPAGIDRVVLVGGSSLMGLVAEEMTALCPHARLARSRVFTAVVDGLAMASPTLASPTLASP